VSALAPLRAGTAVERWRMRLASPLALTAVEDDVDAEHSGEPVDQILIQGEIASRHNHEKDEWAPSLRATSRPGWVRVLQWACRC
jgi:hypothetical protein